MILSGLGSASKGIEVEKVLTLVEEDNKVVAGLDKPKTFVIQFGTSGVIARTATVLDNRVTQVHGSQRRGAVVSRGDPVVFPGGEETVALVHLAKGRDSAVRTVI